jgi:hypothetical protein
VILQQIRDIGCGPEIAMVQLEVGSREPTDIPHIRP